MIQVKAWEELTKDELFEIVCLRSEVFFVEQRADTPDFDAFDRDPRTRHWWVPDVGGCAAYLRTVELDEPGEKKMVLSVKGPKVITAADIKPDAGIKIINPEQVIATVTTDKEINMEFLVDSGEGFVVSDEIDTEGWPIGYLAVDAIYTPIKKVNYTVEDTMVGRVTNYDKLVLEISTDGSIEIHDALSYAVELLILHVKPFTNIGNSMSKFRGNEDEVSSVSAEAESNIEDMKIEELDFTVRSYNCLKKAGVNTISDLTSMTYVELLKIKNLGRKSLNEIIDKMKELGYDLSEEAANQ